MTGRIWSHPSPQLVPNVLTPNPLSIATTRR